MRVFISHAFADREKLADVGRVLSGEGIDCFQPDQMMVGQGLSEQLRDELDRCDGLVFIATRNSIRSDWCNAELGAAWGLRKLVGIYLADSDLEPNDLPGQFRGHLMHRGMFLLAESLKRQLSEEMRRVEQTSEKTQVSGTAVGLEELRKVLRTELQRERAQTWAHEVLVDLRTLIRGDWVEITSRIEELLYRLVGQSYAHIPAPRTTGWPFEFRAETSTGSWNGWALNETDHAGGDLELYEYCVLLHLDKDGVIDGASVAQEVLIESAVGMLGLSPWTANKEALPVTVGRISLGEAIVRRTQ